MWPNERYLLSLQTWPLSYPYTMAAAAVLFSHWPSPAQLPWQILCSVWKILSKVIHIWTIHLCCLVAMFSSPSYPFYKEHIYFMKHFCFSLFTKRCIKSWALDFSFPVFHLMLLHPFKSIILLFHILYLLAVQTIDNTPELSCLRHLLYTNVITIISIRLLLFFLL